MYTKITAAVLLVLCWTQASADDIDDVKAFRQYSESFASAGQPTIGQLELLHDAGFERIVYIAWSDQENAIVNEDRVVRNLGMEYLHIPVEWEAPALSDFELFAGAMQQAPGRKTLLHCQVNYRASVFALLYRTIYMNVPLAEAKSDMNSVWVPNEAWRNLIFEVLNAHSMSPQCEGCDWNIQSE